VGVVAEAADEVEALGTDAFIEGAGRELLFFIVFSI